MRLDWPWLFKQHISRSCVALRSQNAHAAKSAFGDTLAVNREQATRLKNRKSAFEYSQAMNSENELKNDGVGKGVP